MTHPLTYLPHKMRTGQLDPHELQANLETLRHAVTTALGRRFYTSVLSLKFNTSQASAAGERLFQIKPPAQRMAVVAADIQGTFTDGEIFVLRTAKAGTPTDYTTHATWTGTGAFQRTGWIGEVPLQTVNFEIFSSAATWAFTGELNLYVRHSRMDGVTEETDYRDDWTANILTADDGDAATAINAAMVDIESAVAASESGSTGVWGMVIQAFPFTAADGIYTYVPAYGQRLLETHYAAAGDASQTLVWLYQDEVPTTINTGVIATTGLANLVTGTDTTTDTAPNNFTSISADYRFRVDHAVGAGTIGLAYAILWFSEA